MDRPSGPVKKSGKMVTMLMRTGRSGSEIEQALGWIDHHPTRLTIDFYDDVAQERYHDVPVRAAHLEHRRGSQLVHLGDLPDAGSLLGHDLHAQELVVE